MSDDVHRGTHEVASIHEAFQNTIKVLGDIAFTLTTNGDREYFMNVYTEQLNLYMIDVYKVRV
jgi:hypothetical protein